VLVALSDVFCELREGLVPAAPPRGTVLPDDLGLALPVVLELPTFCDHFWRSVPPFRRGRVRPAALRRGVWAAVPSARHHGGGALLLRSWNYP
jgi:hypothetical protein